jgi:hypothetical protein
VGDAVLDADELEPTAASLEVRPHLLNVLGDTLPEVGHRGLR